MTAGFTGVYGSRKMAVSTEKVLRTGRLDAVELDNDLTSIFQERFLDIFRRLPSGPLLERFKPEMKAFIRFLLWKWSLGKPNGSTFGQEMTSLTYVTKEGTGLTSKHRWILMILYVLLEWSSERFEDILSKLIPSLRADRIAACIKFFAQIANLLNFCAFLIQGVYPSLKERVLHLNMVPTKPQTLRELSYENMNREMVWYGFSEFVFFVLPLMNLPLVRNWLKKTLQKYNLLPSQVGRSVSAVNRCSLCNERPVQPQLSNCGHVYCYYCIAANVEADPEFPCSLCNKRATPYTQWNFRRKL